MAKSQQLEISITTLQVLKGALDILKNESNWTKGYFAVDSDGAMCSPSSPTACKFCIIGAMRKAANNDSGTVLGTINHIDIPALSQWNDSPDRKHSEVIDVLKKTIASLENV